MPIVDAHPHIYSPDRKAFPTIAKPWEPGEPAGVDDLKRMMDAVGVDRAVFIQTSTFYGFDNRYVMDSARANADWACGVITLDPDDFSHVDLLEQAVNESNIRGMRGIADSIGRISSPRVYRLWSKAMELGIPVNCMVMDDLDRVPEIERIAQDLGDLKIVIDHCFMLNTRHKLEETLQALERLSKQPNIFAKLTCGTHGSYRVYPFEDMHDPLKRVISAFGAERCLWGSNFPNSLWSKGASYAQNLHLFVKELGLSLEEKAAILGGTAMGLWFPKALEAERKEAKAQADRTVREAARDDEGADEDDQSLAEESRSAEIVNIASIIAGQDNTSDNTDESDTGMSELMDVAGQLNTMLDMVNESAKSVDDLKADVMPESDDLASPTVNVTKLFADQNYTPIKTDEIGEVDSGSGDELDLSALEDVASQLNAMLESVEGVSSVDSLEAEAPTPKRKSAKRKRKPS